MHETTDWRDQIFKVPERSSAHKRKSYDVMSARTGEERKAIILSDRVLRCNCHFNENQSKPCLNTPGCPWCEQGWPKREKGYLCGISLWTGRQVIVELTTGAWEGCPALLNDKESLRGKVLVLSRRGRVRNSPVVARLDRHNTTIKGGDLPPAFDLRAALFTLWEVENTPNVASGVAEEWDGSEPQAPRTRAEDMEG